MRIERPLDATPSRVYSAFATAEGKARWFSGPQTQVLAREFDFRPGGCDRLYCQWPPRSHGRRPSARTTDLHAGYLEIVPARRIVHAYEMFLDERKISVSLATVEFHSHGCGTRLVITEQGAFLAGFRDEGSREQGTNWLTDQLIVSLGVTARRVLSR